MPYLGKEPKNITTLSDLSVSGDVTSTGTVEPAGDTAAGDDAAIGFTSAEGLILTGQGSTSDVTIKNDADATVAFVPTGTDDLRFPDDAQIQMGASGDLVMYHNGSNSFIEDNGTGNFLITTNGNNITFMKNQAETMAVFKTDGACELYDNNVLKLTTTSDGVTVTGDATFTNSDAGTIIARVGTNVAGIKTASGDDFCVGTADFAQAIRIKNTNGHIGVGSTAPAVPFEVKTENAGYQAILDNDNGSAQGLKVRVKANDSGDFNILELVSASTGSDVSVARIADSGDSLFGGDLNTSLVNNGSGFITSGTHHYLKITNTETTSTNSTVYINRHSSDGDLIVFRQANSTEGKISVSGTTVTYAGGHLARWSRLSDNSKPTTLLKGTVMTNLDEMLVWHHEAKAATLYEDDDEIPEGKKVGDEKTPAVDAYDEDNEQHNHTAVSSVEGDVNVAGLFVNWDSEDTYNDFYLGMTGDMVIRIANGTTVERGDLLMSAGDGTAKPQGDDIVRSKTIAKVTSTTVSHTYEDGSHLVPCVLMAC